MAQKILILEDDVFLSKAYVIILSKEGYEVTQFPNGKQGLEATKKEQFDLILLDLLMPEMGGLDFLRLFNAKEHPETKIIVFSNLSSVESIKEATKLGATKYIAKATFSPKEMVELVKETLS